VSQSELRFPRGAAWGTRAAWAAHGARGTAYGEIGPELAAALAGWIAGELPQGTALKAPDVFRCGELVVKFFPRRSRLIRWLRKTPALRSAERYFGLLPIPSPRPLLALEGVGRERDQSLLVSEYVAGPHLWEVWRDDGEARAALPGFLATMHRQRVLHGDLHPRNLLWSGGKWVLLDVDGVRHWFHVTARVIRGQWARLLLALRDEAGLELAYRSYLALLGSAQDPDQGWRAIRARAERMHRTRAG
jgi:hypothetical protein